MAERNVVTNVLPIWLGKRTPSPNVATTATNRWIDGTLGGSATNNQFGFYTITGVGSMEYSIADGAVTLSATTATGRGRVMTATFETTTTQQNVNQYAYRVRPNTSYTFSCMGKGIDIFNSTTCRVSIVGFQSSGATGANGFTGFLPAGTSEWAPYTVTFTTGSTTSFVIIKIEIITAGAVMSASFKDFQLDTTIPSTRTPATTRTTATNRVVVRDMGTALGFLPTTTNKVTLSNSSGQVFNNTDFTITCWYKPTHVGATTDYIFSHAASTGNGNRIYLQLLADLRIGAVCGAGGQNTALRMIPNNWYFIVADYERATRNVSIRVNNALWLTPTASSGLAQTTELVTAFIGNQSSSATLSARGIIDQFFTFERLLTDAEKANLYFNAVNPKGSKKGEYLFNEASGSTALDTSGNGNNGTITGATYTTDVPLTLRATT